MTEIKDTYPASNVPTRGLKWRSAPKDSIGYCCDIRLQRDESGGYVAYAAQLRGVVSEGDNPESAIKNVIEALTAALETYQAENMPIPWSKAEPATPAELSFRVAVNV